MRALFIVISILAVVLLARMTIRLRISWRGLSISIKLSLRAFFGLALLKGELNAQYSEGRIEHGLFINGRPVAPQRESALRHGVKDAALRLPKGFVRRAFLRLGRRMNVASLTSHAVIGNADAAQTALLCGSAYAFVLGICSAFGLLDILYLKISPKFGQNAFEGMAECIVGLKVWHIIDAAVYGLRLHKLQPERWLHDAASH